MKHHKLHCQVSSWYKNTTPANTPTTPIELGTDTARHLNLDRIPRVHVKVDRIATNPTTTRKVKATVTAPLAVHLSTAKGQ